MQRVLAGMHVRDLVEDLVRDGVDGGGRGFHVDGGAGAAFGFGGPVGEEMWRRGAEGRDYVVEDL